MPIQFKGLVNFDTLEEATIKQLAREYYDKLLRDIKDALLVLDLKKYENEGKKVKYALHSRVESGSTLILNTKASDWDLRRTLHKLFKKLERELQHKYKLKGKKD